MLQILKNLSFKLLVYSSKKDSHTKNKYKFLSLYNNFKWFNLKLFSCKNLNDEANLVLYNYTEFLQILKSLNL